MCRMLLGLTNTLLASCQRWSQHLWHRFKMACESYHLYAAASLLCVVLNHRRCALATLRHAAVNRGCKVADMAMNVAATAAGVLAAFYHSPQLAAVLLSCVPLIGIPSALLARFSSRSTLTVQQRYSSAGAVAHEVITTVLQSSVHAQCSGNVRRIAFLNTTTTHSDVAVCTHTVLNRHTRRCWLVSRLWLRCVRSDWSWRATASCWP
jgi:ABC-type multidrug transport system fused ATPase/permease subunit